MTPSQIPSLPDYRAVWVADVLVAKGQSPSELRVKLWDGRILRCHLVADGFYCNDLPWLESLGRAVADQDPNTSGPARPSG